MDVSLSRFSPPIWVALTGTIAVACTAHWITGYMIAATINFFILLLGFTLRKRNRIAHASLMSLGILSDLTIVLILQVDRHAVQTALAFKLSGWNQAHIFCSLTATVLYIPMVILGILLLRGRTSELSLHKKLGWITLLFRTLGYFLMFSMLGKPI